MTEEKHTAEMEFRSSTITKKLTGKFNTQEKIKTKPYQKNKGQATWKCNFPAGNYLFKVNNKSFRARCEICSELTIKTPERRLASFWCLYC